MQFSVPRPRVLLTEFPSRKSRFSGWWIQQPLSPTKDQFPLHEVDITLQWAIGTVSDIDENFASFLYNFYYGRNSYYRKFRGIHPGMFFKSGVLDNIVKFTGKLLWRSLSFNKLADWKPTTLSKKTAAQMFFCEFCKMLKNTILLNIWERLLWKFFKKYCLIKLQCTSLNSVCPVTILNFSFALTFLFGINLQIF